ncbi:MAG: hypothetical protein JW993_09950 [Sedimentisphaerales bacterium]|nr:hypothetical protein [Sedimentisphaerales bacterium]
MFRSSNDVGMYDRRLKIFIGAAATLLLIAVLRLVQMQLLADSRLQDEIAALKQVRGKSRHFGTVRGDILDRNGKVLATDVPQFQIVISYHLTSFGDPRVLRAAEARVRETSDDPSLYEFRTEVEARRADLGRIITDCTRFGVSMQEVAASVREINNFLWYRRAFIAWFRNGPDPNFLARYERGVNSIPLADAMPEFERQVPDQRERDRMILDVDDIPELNKSYPLIDLNTDDDVFAAQMEFTDINDLEIVTSGYRDYPYGSVAAQTIGWTGPAQEPDKGLFERDPLAEYLPGDVCGKRPGVEYVCEAFLRGRRGEQATDIDGNLIRETQARYGQDVQLTLDIELQQQIEQYVTDPQYNPNADANTAVVVLDIRSGDILALVSLPTYDLNRVRYDYDKLIQDGNKPMRHRALSEHYPPGSSVKPIILIAGLEAGAITPDEPISCPPHKAPAGWPNCLIYLSGGGGHDQRWNNIARNAIKGSCNIYFSQLADRLEAPRLQQWLFRFGYGHRLPLEASLPWPDECEPRRFLQAQGQISARVLTGTVRALEDIPPMRDGDKRYFGIGQGNLWASPLQVANSFATIARGGLAIPPRLFLKPKATTTGGPLEPVDLGISPGTLQVVFDGMSAVVNEPGGTAYSTFRVSGLAGQGVKVYGKTGSTQNPENAWFAGFAEDNDGAKIALAIVVEGGQHGSRDAAPLARDVIQLCIYQGYLGTPLADIVLP